MTRDRFAAGVLLAAWTLVVAGVFPWLVEHAPIVLVASGVGTIALLVRQWRS